MKRVSIKYSILFLLLAFTNFIGCGVKGNPVILSSLSDNVRIVQNLKIVSAGNAVMLSWDYYGKDSNINYIAIEKNELGSAGTECRDCPRKFERIAQVSVKEIKQKNNEYRNLNFTDKEVVNGKTYNYRLLICDDFNICRESSETEVNFK
ncbi:MAG: hypothetical protein CVU62_05490 [Deltaproteobacteria bacterium HGW-Deltaproteobacteria-2]|nr:MAG: hypothetical protein CVU62_05490 [Deltaproteobacteria bacterium HGW-Deltaproteobacteria-2]